MRSIISTDRALISPARVLTAVRAVPEHVLGSTSWGGLPGIECEAGAGVLVVEGHHEASAQPHALTGEHSVTDHPSHGRVHRSPSLLHHVPGEQGNVNTGPPHLHQHLLGDLGAGRPVHRHRCHRVLSQLGLRRLVGRGEVVGDQADGEGSEDNDGQG